MNVNERQEGLGTSLRAVDSSSLAPPDRFFEQAKNLYLDLMERCLLNTIYEDAWTDWNNRNDARKFDPAKRHLGRDWPSIAHTMVGALRLRNIRELLEVLIKDGIEGDLIETGVWRGGSCIYMRAILSVYEQTQRRVFVADSFEGLPAPDAVKYPADAGDVHHKLEELAVSLEQVKSNFEKYGLLDEQVVFLKGWFKDTLPSAPIEQLALLRLDGDMYESTMDALNNLYDKVVPGGFIIVDDFGLVPNCRRAIHDFRERNEISDPLFNIDGCGVYWRKDFVTCNSTTNRELLARDAQLLDIGSPGSEPLVSILVPDSSMVSQFVDELTRFGFDSKDVEILLLADKGVLEFHEAIVPLVSLESDLPESAKFERRNYCLRRVSGKWIFIVDGPTSVSLPQLRKIVDCLPSVPSDVGIVLPSFIAEDAASEAELQNLEVGRPISAIELDGVLADPRRELSVLVRRAVFENIGMYLEDPSVNTDWEFFTRSSCHYRWWQIAQRSSGCESGSYRQVNVEELGKIKESIKRYLPGDRAGSLLDRIS